MTAAQQRDLITLCLAVEGAIDSHNTLGVELSAAKAYVARNPQVRYEWWTEKVGPGLSVVAWRLTERAKESSR